MLRAAVLSLIVLVSVATVIPVLDSAAHGNRTYASKRYKRHSRAWWRRYRARMRKRRAMARQRAIAAQKAQALAANRS